MYYNFKLRAMIANLPREMNIGVLFSFFLLVLHGEKNVRTFSNKLSVVEMIHGVFFLFYGEYVSVINRRELFRMKKDRCGK